MEDMTRPGTVLGTAACMSPEQTKGNTVDKRADIWAFGGVLFECLAMKFGPWRECRAGRSAEKTLTPSP